MMCHLLPTFQLSVRDSISLSLISLYDVQDILCCHALYSQCPHVIPEVWNRDTARDWNGNSMNPVWKMKIYPDYNSGLII